ncbi:von Willebrand factor A domain-containing protein 5A-like isoform X2 [Saccostrea cucullata]|uniref:von Willebrand factor A domain-containing protein 5A-like isoform X2 n=1 Tax=Saccostrea cuccullata TaxID=36930 RepID=UPI002ED66879
MDLFVDCEIPALDQKDSLCVKSDIHEEFYFEGSGIPDIQAECYFGESEIPKPPEPYEFKKEKRDHPMKMIKLIEDQKFDGSWELTEEISKILGKSQNEIKTSATTQDVNVWTTALAIAFLRKYFMKQKHEWEMIEEKALNWLKTRDVEGKDVVQEAMNFLST